MFFGHATGHAVSGRVFGIETQNVQQVRRYSWKRPDLLCGRVLIDASTSFLEWLAWGSQ